MGKRGYGGRVLNQYKSGTIIRERPGRREYSQHVRFLKSQRGVTPHVVRV